MIVLWNRRMARVATLSGCVAFLIYSLQVVQLELPVALVEYSPYNRPHNHNASVTTTTATATSRAVHDEAEPLVRYNYTPPPIETALSWLLSSSTKNGSAFRGGRLPPKPIPIQVMEQYKAWHSVEQLRINPHHRRFSVVFYSCPAEAGNRLHHFLSSVYWSILTNRTMLWKYWDSDMCYAYGALYGLKRCHDANVVAECDALLARAPWIPSYDEFVPTLGLGRPYELPFYATHGKHIVRLRFPWATGNNAAVQGVDVHYQDVPFVAFAVTLEKITYMRFPGKSKELLHSDWSQHTNAQLHRHGVEFLFGTLLRYCFELTNHMRESVPADTYLSLSSAVRNQEYYSIALHSRHIDPLIDGCDVSREKTCVRQLLTPKLKKANASSRAVQPSQGRHCAVHLMSDRPCTLTSLMASLPTLGCQVLVAEHQEGASLKKEHGPFAGAGFLQDWALASMAHNAFVGHKRSSSDLVHELLVFDRKCDAWLNAVQSGIVDPKELAQIVDHANIDVCYLKAAEPNRNAPSKAYPREPPPVIADQ